MKQTQQQDEAALAFWLFAIMIGFILVSCIVGCATLPPSPPVIVAPNDICYSKAEHVKLYEWMGEQNDALDELKAQLREERRENEKWHTRNEGLKGYCI